MLVDFRDNTIKNSFFESTFYKAILPSFAILFLFNPSGDEKLKSFIEIFFDNALNIALAPWDEILLFYNVIDTKLLVFSIRLAINNAPWSPILLQDKFNSKKSVYFINNWEIKSVAYARKSWLTQINRFLEVLSFHLFKNLFQTLSLTYSLFSNYRTWKTWYISFTVNWLRF